MSEIQKEAERDRDTEIEGEGERERERETDRQTENKSRYMQGGKKRQHTLLALQQNVAASSLHCF